MTQVIGVVTRDSVFMVSDRRLTWGAGPRFGQLYDDDTCKLVSVCSTCAVAYTGLAQLGAPPRPTHEWIADLLAASDCNRGSIAARILITAASTAFATLPSTPSHSFVIGGWSRFSGVLRSYLCTVTNSIGDDGAPLPSPSRTFIGVVKPLNDDDAPFEMLVAGRPLRSAAREKVLRRMFRRIVERGLSPKRILQLLVDEVVYTSKSDSTVGSKVLATVIPRAAAERQAAQGESMILEGESIDSTASFAYFEPGYEGLAQFGPTFTCNGWALKDTEAVNDGDKQSIQVRVLRRPLQYDPGKTVAIAVRAGPNQGYLWDLGKNCLVKLVDGKLVELKTNSVPDS
jgi:hypothetical protein